jgi:hypothetical protein
MRTDIEKRKQKNEKHRLGGKGSKSRSPGKGNGKKNKKSGGRAFPQHRDREAVHKLLEEQLRRKFAEQKDQIANKIKEVDAAQARLKEHMDQKRRGVFDFGSFNRSAADVLKAEVG